MPVLHLGYNVRIKLRNILVCCQTIYSLSNDFEHLIDIFKDCVTV